MCSSDLPPVERIFEGFGVDASSLGRYQQRGLFDFGAPAGPLSASSSDSSSGSSSVSSAGSSDPSSSPAETVDTGVSDTFSRPVREESADPAADAGNEPKKEKPRPVLDLSAAFGTRKRPKIMKNDTDEGNDASGTSDDAPDSAPDKTTDSAPDRPTDSAPVRMIDSAADKTTDSAPGSVADRTTDSAPDKATDSATDSAPDTVPVAGDAAGIEASETGTPGSGNPENNDKKEKKGQASLFDF